MEICVFGAGSLGSLIGGLLAADHEVTLVGRDTHVSAIETDGLQITGEFDRSVAVRTRTNPPVEADLAVVTVKSFDTPEAARALADTELDGALSLQNGMGNEETLAEVLSCPVLAGTCTYGARLAEPGTVECTGVGDMTLGARDGGESALADRVGEAFAAAGLNASVSARMPRTLWKKLAVNAGINATTALARIPNGALLDGPAAETAAEAARETARVARAAGVDISDGAAVERTREVAAATAANTSSMQQDVLAEKRTEVDAINGYVVDRAERAVPVNETMTRLLRAWEHDHGPGRSNESQRWD
jgi:2-dehydropantoate 2-reductase